MGLDESRQMLSLARRRTKGVPLVRGVIENLPLRAAAFDTAVTTFPAGFIRESKAIREFDRVLRSGGRLVVLPAAQIVGGGAHGDDSWHGPWPWSVRPPGICGLQFQVDPDAP